MTLRGNAVLAQGVDEGEPVGGAALAPSAAHVLTREKQEAFLRSARILHSRPAPKGVTDSRRVTLSDGVLTHDAHVQTVDESRREFRGRTYVELNFRDSWRFNVAAYRLSVLVGLDMVPVAVERDYRGRAAAFTCTNAPIASKGDSLSLPAVTMV